MGTGSARRWRREVEKTHRNVEHVEVIMDETLWVNDRLPRPPHREAFLEAICPRQAWIDSIYKYLVIGPHMLVEVGSKTSPAGHIVAVGRRMLRPVRMVARPGKCHLFRRHGRKNLDSHVSQLGHSGAPHRGLISSDQHLQHLLRNRSFLRRHGVLLPQGYRAAGRFS